MRNLKRALSLTLASVMLLGMMVLGTSAASYPDVTDEHNVEAIEVLQAVGVMSGSTSGNFNPDSQVSRIEMAIVMSNLLNLKVDYFEDQCKFTDVPAWAGKYVAACEANGIVSGIGGGKFGTGNVTATQAALMMLKALGYFQYASDFEGGWDRATAKLAADLSLFNGMDVGNNTALTRNQVAQLALNTLQATMVTAEDNTLHITGGSGDSQFNISGGSVKYIVRTADSNKVGTAIKTTAGTGTAGSQLNGQTLELGEQLYNGELKRTETASTATAFKDPAVRWTYKAREIGTYAKEADLVYSKDVALKDIFKDLGLGTSLTTTYYRNGAAVRVGAGTKNENLVDLTDTATASAGNIKIGGKGTQIKVYLIAGSPDTVSVVMTDYYLAQATEDYDSNKEELRIITQSDDIALSASNSTLKLEDFPAIASAKEDDYLVITVISGEVKSVALAEVVADVTISGARANDYVNTSSGKYTYNDGAKNHTEVGKDLIDGTLNYSMNDNTYNLYLDPNGYVLGVKSAKGDADVSEYVFISDQRTNAFDVVAKAVFTDGSDATITVSKVGGTTVTSTSQVPVGFYTFKTTSSGKYELTAITNSTATGSVTWSSTGSAKLDNKAQPIRDGAGNAAVSYSANANTVFIAKDKAYVGVKNAPETKTTGTVYYVLDRNNRLMIVYTAEKGANSTSADDLVYILTGTTERTKEGDDWYYLYKAVVQGEKTETFAANDNLRAPGLYEVSSYTDGRADLPASPITDSVTNSLVNYVATVTSADWRYPTLTLGGSSFVLAENYKIVTVNDTTVEQIGAGSVKKAVEDGFTTAYAIETSTSNDNISLVILVKGTSTVLFGGNATASNIASALGSGTNVGANGAVLDTTNVADGKTLTLGGTAEGAPTTGGSGKIVLDNTVVKAGQELDLSGAKAEGKVTVPADSTLKLGTQATGVTVAVEEGGKVAVTKDAGAVITFEGEQTEPVEITGLTGSDDFQNDNFKNQIAALLPDGGQVTLTNSQTSEVYNSDWGMINLVIPGTQTHIVIDIYDEDDVLWARTGDTVATTVKSLIGLTTDPLNEGAFEYAKGNAADGGKSISLPTGTYKYVVKNATVTWADNDNVTVAGAPNHTTPGTVTGSEVILEGYFTVE